MGQKKPNPWGLHDMHGHVWEFCRDVYVGKLPGGRDPEVKVNPDEKSKAVFRVVRGGCRYIGYPSSAAWCRSGMRSGYEQNKRDEFYGFRVTLSAVQPVK